jgi:phosphate transport system substrate-binding protein
MNDDFLRSAWRRPPAAFEQQLRERLQRQELAPPPQSRTNWRLLIVAVLVGGSALAAATYLTVKHFSSLESPTSQTRPTPAAATPLAQPDSNRHAANLTKQSNTAAAVGSSSNAALASTPNATTPPSPASATSIRIALSPQLAALAKDFSTQSRYNTSSIDTQITSADTALKALCTEASSRPDVVLASRRIDKQELDTCNQSAADGVMEAKLGHMAIVVSRAQAGTSMQLSADAILRAVLKRVPSQQDPQQLIDNPYTQWHQIDPAADPHRIDVFGPPRDSEEFAVFAATVLEPACDAYPWIRALQSTDRSAYEEICHTVRDDGVYKSAPRDSNFVRQRLWADPAIVAVIDYPFYSANSADLIGSLLAGPPPTPRSVVDGSYAWARPVYFYVSRARYTRTPAVSAFVNDYLRRQDFASPRWMTRPDGNPNARPTYRPLSLMEVRLDE